MSAPAPAAASASPPWWAHTVTGVVVLGAGVLLYYLGAVMLGEGLIVAGVGFLGVGSGVAAAS